MKNWLMVTKIKQTKYKVIYNQIQIYKDKYPKKKIILKTKDS